MRSVWIVPFPDDERHDMAVQELEPRADSSNVGGSDADEFLERRTLRSGSAGWVLLAGLGVSYVISGDYSGWNAGLGQGGFGGMLVAVVVVAAMYFALVLGMAELSSSMPSSGGGYTFARRALGPWGGYATGVAVLLEYTVAAAAISTFIGAYVESLGLFGLQSAWPISLVMYLMFTIVHLCGAGEALRVMFAVTAVAFVGLVLFVFGALPHVQVSLLFDIPVANAPGASSFLPHGFIGIWAALPFAIWFFLAVEGVPLAAEEAANPARDVPRGILVSMAVLTVAAFSMLVLAPAAGGAAAMSVSGNPLVEALHGGWLAQVVNYIALAGLIASFFSIMYAYSRQVFALSRAGYLPTALSVTNSRQAPVLALVVPGIVGFALATTGRGSMLLNMAVFGAAVSYVLILVSHIVLRLREPGMDRPYRTPGGIVTTGAALVVALAAVVATFLVDSRAAGITLLAFMAFLAWFGLYSRHHLVAGSPDEEYALLTEMGRDAGSDLARKGVVEEVRA